MIRVALRTAGWVVVTLCDYAGMETARALSPRSHSRAVTHRWMHRYGRQVLHLFGGRVATNLEGDPFLQGRDARGIGRLFVLNHRSMLDVFVYLSFVEANALSRADLATWPILGRVAKRVGTVFVDRSDRRSGASAVAAMTAALLEGRGILAYPEGTTFDDDVVRPFRMGAFVAAARAGAEVVPLGLAYQSRDACYLDETALTHWKRLGSMPRVHAALEVGPPIAPGRTAEELAQVTHEQVQDLVHRARGRLKA